MRLRYAGTCVRCSRTLPAGAHAVYLRPSRSVRCLECSVSVTAAPADDPSGSAPPLAADDATRVKVPRGSDIAGGSARGEYERRKAKREETIRARYPRLGGLILALSDDPQSTRAWERGAIGEEMMAARLADLPQDFRVMHDRRIPGSRANIDHLIVGPTGVWVVDAKCYRKKRPELRIEGGMLRPRVESLRIGGRSGDKLVVGVQGQVQRVRDALGNDSLPVRGVLCFLEADWPLIGGAFSVKGIEVVWPRLLIKRMTSGPTTVQDVVAVAARLSTVFPPHE